MYNSFFLKPIINYRNVSQLQFNTHSPREKNDYLIKLCIEYMPKNNNVENKIVAV